MQDTCLIYDAPTQTLQRFNNPLRVISCDRIERLLDCLSEVEQAFQQGKFAAGFVCYEAASAFDEAFATHPLDSFPLLRFCIYDACETIPFSPDKSAVEPCGPWYPSIDKADYLRHAGEIKSLIREGETYQVNYTFKLKASFQNDPESFFLAMQKQLKAEYAACITFDHWAICSFSPELFFTLENETLISKPMKGTIARGMTLENDQEQKQRLALSEKDRAENVMITDMIRNDMGQIADPGSVGVSRVCEVDRHTYVWQMTSTVSATTPASLPEIFKALFPCSSITGAPKVNTTRIIRELEPEARGIYTGAIGLVRPGGNARFNVAIRTLLINRDNNSAEYGVGSGIVWDSDPEQEYRECLLKAEFLTRMEPDFDLLESMLWSRDDGYHLLEEHLQRLGRSARYFGFPFDKTEVRQALDRFHTTIEAQQSKIRLLLDRTGRIQLEAGPLGGVKTSCLKMGLAKEAIDSTCRFLYHKTTWREIYQKAASSRPDCDDAVLWNERGEITETCRSNIVINLDGKRLTPPVHCGLLPGTFREYLLRSGDIQEAVISKAMLQNCQALYTINSVRGWMNAVLIDKDLP